MNVGDRLGRLTLVSYLPKHRPGTAKSRWVCRCDCGNKTTVDASDLSRGRTRSCGCLRSEQSRASQLRHGRSRTREYRCWCNAKSRCYNRGVASWKDYGGRGITMCPRWRDSFETFLADMGMCPPGRSLDRIKNDENYKPGNCRWATRSEQMKNRRPMKRKKVTHA